MFVSSGNDGPHDMLNSPPTDGTLCQREGAVDTRHHVRARQEHHCHLGVHADFAQPVVRDALQLGFQGPNCGREQENICYHS